MPPCELLLLLLLLLLPLPGPCRTACSAGIWRQVPAGQLLSFFCSVFRAPVPGAKRALLPILQPNNASSSLPLFVAGLIWGCFSSEPWLPWLPTF